MGLGGGHGVTVFRRHLRGLCVSVFTQPLPCGVVDGAWLRVALALSIGIFWRGTPSIPWQSRRLRLSQQIDQEGHETSLVAVHIRCIDGWMTIIAASTKLE